LQYNSWCLIGFHQFMFTPHNVTNHKNVPSKVGSKQICTTISIMPIASFLIVTCEVHCVGVFQCIISIQNHDSSKSLTKLLLSWLNIKRCTLLDTMANKKTRRRLSNSAVHSVFNLDDYMILYADKLTTKFYKLEL
jgi:hypothetical protein